MQYEEGSGGGPWIRRNWKTFSVLLFLLALSAFFRIGFNFGPAMNDGEPRFAGNDDYYHLRVVEYVMETGDHLERDPLLNYPLGAINPRPPVYDWHVAILGQFIAGASGMEESKAAAYALEWGSAVWGVLTILPIWMIGRLLYSNRAGLWAGFLMAASPAHIQRSGFGLGDHDAFILFFLVLGVYFLLRALRLTRDDTRVESWRSLRSISQGFGTYIEHHREGLAYAFLAGACWVTIALMWEGFPYVTAIYAVYYGFQLLTNQLRRRDSTGDVLVMLILLGMLVLVPMPYYWTVGHIGLTLNANAYIFAGLVLATLVLVPTRDLPSILVLPSVAGAAIVAWAVLTFALPDIGRQVFTANGYFLQSKLYSTIAEAQRTELGFFVFSIGFMTFFLALVGFGYALARFFRERDRSQLFMVAWGLISIYMAFAATRFVFNAAPAFAVLGGWMLDKVTGWMNWRERARDFQSLRHESWAKAVRSSVGSKQIAGSLFIGLTLILPNVWFSFDAGLPGDVQRRFAADPSTNEYLARQTGAFGQGFLADDWIDTYAWLCDQDATAADGSPVPPEDRPAHVAWWDYGFWEVALGCHPTVADNFQNGFRMAGRVLTAESEQEYFEWLSIRLLEADYAKNGGAQSADVRAALAQTNASLPEALPARVHAGNYDQSQEALHMHLADVDAAVDLYVRLTEATGWRIDYLLVDIRMLPLDDPGTAFRIESSSIFYAPALLADRNPDDFVQTVYEDENRATYHVIGYAPDPTGGSRQLSRAYITNDNDINCASLRENGTRDPKCTLYVDGGGALIRTLDGQRIDYGHNGGQGVPLVGIRLDFKEDFYKTMFYRAYQGGEGNHPGASLYHESQPGNGLKHLRVVQRTDGLNPVRLLKFYQGAELNGRVLMDNGESLAGVQVEVVDEFGAVHDRATTDEQGNYRLIMPFSTVREDGTLNNVTVRLQNAGIEFGSKSFQISEEQANRKEQVAGGDFNLTHGSLDVFAFVDRNRNDTYDAGIDYPAAGAAVSWGGNTGTVGTDGHVVFGRVRPGGGPVNGTLDGHDDQPRPIGVGPGEQATANLSFRYETVDVNATVVFQNGTNLDPMPGVSLTVSAVNATTEYTQDVTSPPPTDANGTASLDLIPGGSYRFETNFTRVDGGQNFTYTGSVTRYVAAPGLAAPAGVPEGEKAYQKSITVEIRLTRTAA